MTDKKEKRINPGCLIDTMISGIIITIFAVIIGVFLTLTSKGIPTLVNTSDKAKEKAVKANVSAAKSTIVTRLTIEEEYITDKAVAEAIKDLNEAGTPEDPEDDALSPYNSNLPAFSKTPYPGVVVIKAIDSNTIKITGYGKDTKIIVRNLIKKKLII